MSVAWIFPLVVTAVFLSLAALSIRNDGLTLGNGAISLYFLGVSGAVWAVWGAICR